MGAVEWKFDRAAAQLYVGDRPHGRSFVSWSGVDYEKRAIAASGKCLEVPAGAGHAVDFVVNAREKGDPHILPHDATSEEMLDGIAEVSVLLKARRNTHWRVAFSIKRMPPRICSTNLGGAFQNVQSGRSVPVVWSG